MKSGATSADSGNLEIDFILTEREVMDVKRFVRNVSILPRTWACRKRKGNNNASWACPIVVDAVIGDQFRMFMRVCAKFIDGKRHGNDMLKTPAIEVKDANMLTHANAG